MYFFTTLTTGVLVAHTFDFHVHTPEMEDILRYDLTEKSTHEFFEDFSREYHRDHDNDSYDSDGGSYDGERDYGD
jgi:hypothetical protein